MPSAFSSSRRPRSHRASFDPGASTRTLAGLVAAILAAGCAEKFDLPPVPEAVPPEPGSYNFDRDWADVGEVLDMVLVGGGEGALYVLTERDGARAVEGYFAGFAEATAVDNELLGSYPGLRRPTSLAYVVSGQQYLFVVDQRGPDLLVREAECDGAGCAMALRVDPDAVATRHLAGREFENGVDRDFTLTCRLRVGDLEPGKPAWLALGTAEGRVGVWLEVYLVGGEGFLRPVRSDGAFPVDSTSFALEGWHDVEVTHTWASGHYALAVDGVIFTERVPVYHRMNRPLRAMSVRIEGTNATAALDDLLLVAPDVDPPGRILDLQGAAVSAAAADLQWTAPGDGFAPEGRAVEYEIQWATRTRDFDVGAAEVAPDPPIPQEAGSEESYRLEEIPLADTVYVAVRARDDGLNWSELSNIALIEPFAPRGSGLPHLARAATAGPPRRVTRGEEAVPDTVLRLDFDDPGDLDDWGMGRYFTNDPAPAILRFGLRADLPVRTYTDPQWVSVEGVAVQTDGTLLVSVREKDPTDPTGVLERGQIARLAPDGTRLAALAGAGSGLGFVNDPRGIATDGTDVVVADAGQAWVQKFDPETSSGLLLIPEEPQPDPWFQSPVRVATDASRYIYVADPAAGRVLRFTPSGAFADTVYAMGYPPTEEAGTIVAPRALAADDDEVWLADPTNRRIVVLKKADAISSEGEAP